MVYYVMKLVDYFVDFDHTLKSEGDLWQMFKSWLRDQTGFVDCSNFFNVLYVSMVNGQTAVNYVTRLDALAIRLNKSKIHEL